MHVRTETRLRYPIQAKERRGEDVGREAKQTKRHKPQSLAVVADDVGGPANTAAVKYQCRCLNHFA